MWIKINDNALYDDNSLYEEKNKETIEDIKKQPADINKVKELNTYIKLFIDKTYDNELKDCYNQILELSDDTIYEYHKKLFLFNNGKLRQKKEIKKFHKMYNQKDKYKEVETSLDRYKFKGCDGDILWTIPLIFIPVIIICPLFILILPFIILLTGISSSVINLKIDKKELKIKLSKKYTTQEEISLIKDMIIKDSASLTAWGLATFSCVKNTKNKIKDTANPDTWSEI